MQDQAPLENLHEHISTYLLFTTTAFSPLLATLERGDVDVAPQTAVPSAKCLHLSAL
jgi:hypothetical protein